MMPSTYYDRLYSHIQRDWAVVYGFGQLPLAGHAWVAFPARSLSTHEISREPPHTPQPPHYEIGLWCSGLDT